MTTTDFTKILGDTDIKNLLNHRTIIRKYKDLPLYKSAHGLTSKYGNAVILFPTKSEDFGHWTCLLKTVLSDGSPTTEFFDPYAIYPDNEHLYSQHMLQYGNYLANLLAKTPGNISWNQYPVQLMEKGINTCGKHVVNRIRHADWPLEKYMYFFGTRDGVLGDEIINHVVKL